ncbi:MAG: GntR family transcriptional regulator [Christensenellales bacterium]
MATRNRSISTAMEVSLRERIQNGEWAVDCAVPSENELARQYSVSRMTARSVLTQLVGAGLLYRIPGKGTFVAQEPTLVLRDRAFCSIREQLTKQGHNVSTQLLSMGEIAATESVAKKLDLHESAPVLQVHKLRFLESKPISLHTSFFPLSRCPGLQQYDFVERDSCVVIEEHYGIKRARVKETLESTLATFQEASKLGILPGHPLLLLDSVVYSTEKYPYEYAKVVYRGDMIKISFDYEDDIR